MRLSATADSFTSGSYSLRSNNYILGISCVLIGMTAMSLMDATIKFLSGDYPLHEIVLVRTVVAIVLTLFVVHMEGGLGLLNTSRPVLHFSRGMLVAVANMTFYLALAVMPLAEATAIFFVAPLLITALSGPFLGERVGWRRWTAVIVGFIGVLIMMRIGTDAINKAALLPVIAATAYAFTQIIARKLGTTEKASVMSFYISVTFIVISVGFWIVAGDGSYAGMNGPGLEFLFRAWRWPEPQDMALMIVIGLLVAIVGYMLSQAYRVAEANVVAPFEYIAMPLSVLWGYAFWRETPDTLAIVGMILIGGSGLYIFLREHRMRGPVDETYGIE